MHPTVKELRGIIKGVEGAWVRRRKDGELWVGVGQPGFACDLREVGSYILDVGRARAIGLVKRGALRVLP